MQHQKYFKEVTWICGMRSSRVWKNKKDNEEKDGL